MHYRNGREAKLGDTILVLNGAYSKVGALVRIIPGSNSCNGMIVTGPSEYATLNDCVHIDDATAMFPDRSKAVPQDAPPKS